MTRYDEVKADLQANPKTWLITGVAGFIGSNLLETLLKLDQTVVGLDNFATGHQHNLDEVQTLVTEEQWGRFRFIEGDIRKLEDCREAVKGTDYVLHQAALGSVPRSIEDPIATNQANIDGFLNMLVAAKDEEVSSFTYAAVAVCCDQVRKRAVRRCLRPNLWLQDNRSTLLQRIRCTPRSKWRLCSSYTQVD